MLGQILGVLRFVDITNWWDSEDWEGSVDNAEIAPRGRLFLEIL